MTTSEIIQELSSGFSLTLLIFSITLVCSIPLGLIFSVIQRSKIKPIKWLMDVIVWVVRGTPLMLQIFAIYYGPNLVGLDGLNFNELTAVSVAFSLNYACYFSVIFKGGMDSIAKGQYEACQLLGMTKVQSFKHVILPQVYKRVLPASSNEIITLVKDTSLANVIGVSELVFKGKILLNKGLLLPFFSTGLFYLIFVGLLTIIFKYLEKRSNRWQ